MRTSTRPVRSHFGSNELSLRREWIVNPRELPLVSYTMGKKKIPDPGASAADALEILETCAPTPPSTQYKATGCNTAVEAAATLKPRLVGNECPVSSCMAHAACFGTAANSKEAKPKSMIEAFGDIA